MAIVEVEAQRRFGERDEFGNRPTLATMKARAEREKAMDETQRATLSQSQRARMTMSIVRCDGCDRQIDTDEDVDSFVAGPVKIMNGSDAPHLCRSCRNGVGDDG